MSASHISKDTSQSYLRSSAYVSALVCLALTSSSCAKGNEVSDCNYIDAFEKAVSIDDFSASKGRGDAEKLFGQGHVVFLGGYMETGPITNILYDEPNNIYNDNLEKILLKYGIDKVKKVYLTSKLNKIKSYGFLQSDDGLVGGTQVETGCYNDTVRQYAFNFNKTMFDLSSKNLEK